MTMLFSYSHSMVWSNAPPPRTRGRGEEGGGGTPIYFLYRDIPPVRVSFSGFHIVVPKQGHHCKSSPFLPLRPHNFHWFCVPSLKCMKTQTFMCCLHCFEYSNAWSSLEQGNKLQHVLLDRVIKFKSLHLQQGQGFIEPADGLSVSLASSSWGQMYVKWCVNVSNWLVHKLGECQEQQCWGQIWLVFHSSSLLKAF